MQTILAGSGLGSWIQRSWAAVLLGGRVIYFILLGKIDRRNSIEQMMSVGPASLVIALITAAVIGMIFTIQVAREFLQLGAGSAVGGILAIALARELCPVMMGVVVAGRVGSAFAAEIGTMRVTEQVDALYMLKTNPIEYLVVPRGGGLLSDGARIEYSSLVYRVSRGSPDRPERLWYFRECLFRLSSGLS